MCVWLSHALPHAMKISPKYATILSITTFQVYPMLKFWCSSAPGSVVLACWRLWVALCVTAFYHSCCTSMWNSCEYSIVLSRIVSAPSSWKIRTDLFRTTCLKLQNLYGCYTPKPRPSAPAGLQFGKRRLWSRRIASPTSWWDLATMI